MNPQPSPAQSRPNQEASVLAQLKTSIPSNDKPSSASSHSADDRQQILRPSQDDRNSPSRPRRFLVQPLETTSRSSHRPQAIPAPNSAQNHSKASDFPPGDQNQPGEDPARGQTLPGIIETTKVGNRGTTLAATKTPGPGHSDGTTIGPRRFKPEVIETEHRSVKGKLSEISHQRDARSTSIAPPGLRSEPLGAAHQWDRSRNTSTHLIDSKFSYVNLLRRYETRRHSFRVPELPPIPSSSSSEESAESAESTSPSSIPTKASQKRTQDQITGKILRESCDGEFSEYLLSLAARSAQKQLKEQALAAFPNEQVYQPVDHFAIDEEDREIEEEDWMYPQTYHLKSRRQSSADLTWELEYMRQHKEEAEQRLRAMVAPQNVNMASTGRDLTPKPPGPRPPMLGHDIVLPWSQSPDGTLCESIGIDKSSQAHPDCCIGCGGLWCATNRAEDGRGLGLWMGTCRKDKGHGRGSPVLTGIMTPMTQNESQVRSLLFSGPLRSHRDTLTQDGPRSDVDTTGKTLDDEFHDGFVTQIYNYLSLGYPCVARYYDHELSRISAITIDSLRQDDSHTDARGYVVAPENDTTVACMRWKALRLYIHEWARQQPSMAEDDTGLEAWGVPERRGSWAV